MILMDMYIISSYCNIAAACKFTFRSYDPVLDLKSFHPTVLYNNLMYSIAEMVRPPRIMDSVDLHAVCPARNHVQCYL